MDEHVTTPRTSRPPPLALGHHVIMRLVHGAQLPSPPDMLRRCSAIVLARGASRGLIAFRVVDTHIHAVLLCDRHVAGVFARSTEAALSLSLALRPGFDAAHFRPIVDRFHLANAVRYVLRQEERHGLDRDRLHDGSSVPDMLGLRVLDPGLGRRLRDALPRTAMRDWIEPLGWVGFEGAPLPIDALTDAAAAAFALGTLRGRADAVVDARRAAARVAREAALSVTGTAALLGVTPRSVRRLLQEGAPAAAVRAVLLQLRLRGWLGRAGANGRPK